MRGIQKWQLDYVVLKYDLRYKSAIKTLIVSSGIVFTPLWTSKILTFQSSGFPIFPPIIGYRQSIIDLTFPVAISPKFIFELANSIFK